MWPHLSSLRNTFNSALKSFNLITHAVQADRIEGGKNSVSFIRESASTDLKADHRALQRLEQDLRTREPNLQIVENHSSHELEASTPPLTEQIKVSDFPSALTEAPIPSPALEKSADSPWYQQAGRWALVQVIDANVTVIKAEKKVLDHGGAMLDAAGQWLDSYDLAKTLAGSGKIVGGAALAVVGTVGGLATCAGSEALGLAGTPLTAGGSLALGTAGCIAGGTAGLGLVGVGAGMMSEGLREVKGNHLPEEKIKPNNVEPNSVNSTVTIDPNSLTIKISDNKLNNIIKDLNKGVNSTNRIGNGTTAAAIRNEIKTGLATQGKFHIQKGKEYIRALEKWLEKNPNSTSFDRKIAQETLQDLNNALKGN